MTTDENRGETPEENLRYNQGRWGQKEKWESVDSWGYNWSAAKERPTYALSVGIAEQMLLPHLAGRRQLKILEVAPGAGRFTTELIRLAYEMYVLDMNQACIDICKERFKWYDNINYLVNDGVSCDMVPDVYFELIASFDSFVHIHPDIIRNYVHQFAKKLVPNGLIWIHHSAHGVNPVGHRTDMTDKKMQDFAADAGLFVEAQHYTSTRSDCISVLRKVN